MLNGLKILVVETNTDSSEMYRLILERWGAEVSVVGDVSAAIMALQHHRVDVVITALRLSAPEDGYSLFTRVRSLEPDAGGSTPIIGVSGLALSELDELGIKAHFDGFLQKPVEVEKLSEMIVRLTDQSAAPSQASI